MAYVIREEKYVNPDNRARLDLTSTSASGTRAIDTSIATPGISGKPNKQNHLDINVLTPFAAADLRIKTKNTKWMASCAGSRYLFTPMVFEATGAIPPTSVTFLMESANRAQEHQAHQVRNLMNETLQKIIRAIWIGNADLVATALWQAASGKFSAATQAARETRLFDFSDCESGCVSVGGTIYGYLDIICDFEGINAKAAAGAELELLKGTKEEERQDAEQWEE